MFCFFLAWYFWDSVVVTFVLHIGIMCLCNTVTVYVCVSDVYIVLTTISVTSCPVKLNWRNWFFIFFVQDVLMLIMILSVVLIRKQMCWGKEKKGEQDHCNYLMYSWCFFVLFSLLQCWRKIAPPHPQIALRKRRSLLVDQSPVNVCLICPAQTIPQSPCGW